MEWCLNILIFITNVYPILLIISRRTDRKKTTITRNDLCFLERQREGGEPVPAGESDGVRSS